MFGALRRRPHRAGPGRLESLEQIFTLERQGSEGRSDHVEVLLQEVSAPSTPRARPAMRQAMQRPRWRYTRSRAPAAPGP